MKMISNSGANDDYNHAQCAAIDCSARLVNGGTDLHCCINGKIMYR